MSSPFTADQLQALVEIVERFRREHGRKEEASFAELVVDLAELSSTGFKAYKPGQAFGLVFPSGVAGPVLQLQGRGIGYVPRFAPGDCVKGFFEEVQIRTAPNAPTSGKVTLLVVFSPFADFRLTGGGVVGGYSAVTYNATYNSAAGNIPTTAAQGISLEGVKGFQVNIEPAMGLITAGDVRLWMYNAAAGRWAYTETLYTPTPSIGTSPQSWQGPGEVIAVPGVGARVYAELVSMTLSTGSAPIPVRLETFG